MTTTIRVGDREIGLGAHPVGLDLNRVGQALEQPHVQQRMEVLRSELGNTRLVLSVERLDYTKGILEKLEAFDRLLEEHPELLGKVTLMTVCVPADREMTIYRQLQTDIEQAVGRINGQYARVGWTPIQFFFRGFPFEELVAWYAMADVMWITPLRDGLNLVAKEYVATQGMTDGRGVLVLSEFAGAAAELRGALLTNPHDPGEMARTCYLALAMQKDEAKDRLQKGYEVVSYYDIELWGREFLEAVGECRKKRQASRPGDSSGEALGSPTTMA
jgi:trehalose-6-phosphate synthase